MLIQEHIESLQFVWDTLYIIKTIDTLPKKQLRNRPQATVEVIRRYYYVLMTQVAAELRDEIQSTGGSHRL